VYVLVHPFFTISRQPSLIINPKIRKSIQFLFGVWGKRIRVAARDPQGILILITPSGSTLRFSEEKKFEEVYEKWFVPKANKMVDFAKRKLGGRLIVRDNSFFFDEGKPNRGLLHQLHERGFMFRSGNNEQTKGMAFGEYIDKCINIEANSVQSALGLPRTGRWQDARYSLRHPDEKKDYGYGVIPPTLDEHTRRDMGRFSRHERIRTKRLRK
jgi:hypothetical protein